MANYLGCALGAAVVCVFALLEWDKLDAIWPRSGRLRAAVVEYAPVAMVGDEDPVAYMLKNVAKYREFVNMAADKSADIIVFPEYGLTSDNILALNSSLMAAYVQSIEEDGSNSVVVSALRDVAAEFAMYVVVNLVTKEKCANADNKCPDNGYHFYNSAVAFDRNGNIVGRYRKFHLYGNEPAIFSSPSTPDVAYFDTDLDVRVGFLTCFDMMFDSPAEDLIAAKVDVIAFTSDWIDEVPFHTALQRHSGWALKIQTTVLASNYHNPMGGALGSGIYDGRRGVLAYTSLEGASWTLANIPPNKGGERGPEQHFRTEEFERFVLEENLSNYSHVFLDAGPTTAELEAQGCMVNYKLLPRDGPSGYALVAFLGARSFAGGKHWLGVHVCGVVFCSERGNFESCGKKPKQGEVGAGTFLHIRLQLRNSAASPAAMTLQFEAVEFGLSKDVANNLSSVDVTKQYANLYSVSLFARIEDLDSGR